MTPRQLLTIGLVLVFVAAGWVLMRGLESTTAAIRAATESSGDAIVVESVSAELAPVSAGPVAAPDAPPHPIPDFAAELGATFESLFPTDDPAWAWSRVDLDALREAMPDNTFWTLGVPTDDPAVLAARREHKDRMNRALGVVMSNTGSEEQVRDYYEERERISSDYIAFASELLESYGDVLPERDRGFVRLALNMHRARLEEMPRHLREALTRREAHAAAREAWLAEEALFDASAGEERAD